MLTSPVSGEPDRMLMALRTERVSVAAPVLDGCGVSWSQAAKWLSSVRNNCTINNMALHNCPQGATSTEGVFNGTKMMH
jgi:hypothetical protein